MWYSPFMTASKSNMAAARRVLEWAKSKNSESALAWAQKELRTKYGLGMDLKPLTQAEKQASVRDLEREYSTYRQTPNTSFWRKK